MADRSVRKHRTTVGASGSSPTLTRTNGNQEPMHVTSCRLDGRNHSRGERRVDQKMSNGSF
ncbi:hypothetical protein OUZ56_031679 [Daphnia magna]|uniref:Uncharacterized protein n=1 Tax=Daphnia magna TaxID=35525 RepID=A0ABQ9ZUW6_9CRUS|nr:hypothetical protein OUZ56_031679 [Daphnia magna]